MSKGVADSMEILFKVTDQGTAASNWNERCLKSIGEQRIGVESRYGIRIGQTEIYCTGCRKSWSTFHVCKEMSPERQAEVERLMADLDRPCSLKSFSERQAEMGIEVGMTKEQAWECFREWRDSKKTCERCNGTEYVSFCPVHLICEEADTAQEAEVRGNIATLKNTPVSLPSMPILTTSISILSTFKKGGDEVYG
jgi:hypothetical protein